MAVRTVSRNDDMRDGFGRGDGALEFRQQLLGDDENPRAAVVEHVLVIGLGHQRIDRNGDDARFDRAEERSRPIDGVEKADQNAFLAAQPE